MLTAFLASQAGRRPAFIVPGTVCIALGLWWRRLPAPEVAAKRAAATFPEIPPHLVRRAVVVLVLIAVVSGLVFNAFTLLLPKVIEERLGGDGVRRRHPVHRRPADRPDDAAAGVPADQRAAGA